MQQIWIIALTMYQIFEKFAERKDAVDLKLPENLLIGAAGASYQIEGAWNMDGKAESIWDKWTHTQSENIVDRSNGDIACNSYYKYKEDVQRIKSIGLDFYRFSVGWARVLPTGDADAINEDGLQYYKNLTAELVAHGIEPVVTIYHWDHPQILEEMGGWTNELMVDRFVSYARVLFEALGDRVKIWSTINEPNIFCTVGYTKGAFAPGKKLSNSGKYNCMHNALKAHAKTYHMYDEEFRPTQQGEIGIVSQCFNYIAANNSDVSSVETAFQFECGWINHPIYKGDYPEIMKTRIAKISTAQGHSRSSLPKFTDEWISYIKGTADYFGLNYYTSQIVASDPDEKLGKYNSENGLTTSFDPSWPGSSLPWLYDHPQGLGDILRKIKDEYNNPPVRIMENGYADKGELDDYSRISYHYGHLKELSIAVKKSGCNVKSYSIWSIMDNFEWNNGYTIKFGILSVNFDDPDRPRTAKLSTSWWTKVLETRELQPVPTNSYSENMHTDKIIKSGRC